MVQSIASAAGDSLFVDTYTPGGYSLELHSVNSLSLQKISAMNWDFVVLQDQSTLPAMPEADVQVSTYPFAEDLVNFIKSNHPCSEAVFFNTWGRENGLSGLCATWPPVCDYEGMQQLLDERYQVMAEQNNSTLAPVGRAWKSARLEHPDISLYTSDESHPSLAGSYLAALVFYYTMFGNDSEHISDFNPGIPAADQLNLIAIAREKVFGFMQLWIQHGNIVYADAQAVLISNPINFSNNSLNATDYLWDMGDGTSYTDEEPNHTFANPGNFPIQLIASNNCFADTLTFNQTVPVIGDIDLLEEFGINVFAAGPKNLQVEFYADDLQSKKISIYTLNGQELLAEKELDNWLNVIKHDIPQGLYIVRLNLDGRIIAKKMYIE